MFPLQEVQLIRALKIVKLLQQGQPLTAKTVAKELEIDISNAHGWITAASIVFPIWSPNEEIRKSGESTLFQLVSEEDVY